MSILKLVYYVFLLRFFNFATTKAQFPAVYLHSNCTPHTNFTDDVVTYYQYVQHLYSDNVQTLLQSLRTNATVTTEFYTSAAGGNTSEAAYGLFMCRGDVPHQLCHGCVLLATERLSSECEDYKEAIVWYDECMVRYSNRSFFSTVDERPRFGLPNTAYVSNPEKFSQVLEKALNDTVAKAVNSGLDGSKNFATNEVNISQFQTVYCLVQCTPDLSARNCNSCLRDVIRDVQWCCAGKQGGSVLYPSCNFRYELYRFYGNFSAQAPNSAPNPTPEDSGSATTGKGKGKGSNHSLTVAMVVVAIAVLLLLCD